MMLARDMRMVAAMRTRSVARRVSTVHGPAWATLLVWGTGLLACQGPSQRSQGGLHGANAPAEIDGVSTSAGLPNARDPASSTAGKSPTDPSEDRSKPAGHEPQAHADDDAIQGKMSGDALDPKLFDEVLYLDWEDEAFAADLNADGKPERISWTCGETFTLKIGNKKIKETEKLVELQGCSAAAFPVGPSTEQDTSSREHGVAFCLHDHDEVGPPHCFIYRLQSGDLDEIWAPIGRLSFHASGAIASEDEECYEGRGVLETTTQVLVWNGQAFDRKEMRLETPVSEGDCAEP